MECGKCKSILELGSKTCPHCGLEQGGANGETFEVIEWNAFPARKLIAGGTLLIVLLFLLLSGNEREFQYLLFAWFFMKLLEDCLDIIEAHKPIKTGIFQSKIKYFMFLDGGAAIIWFALRTLLPHGLTGTVGVVSWIVLGSLLLLTVKPSSSAAAKRAMRVIRIGQTDDENTR